MSTPIRRQYLRAKRPFPDALLFFRLGDCYEMYDGDALVVACELSLTLATRAFAKDERVPMCSVPCHAAEGHIKRLVARGHKVAIVEQIGDPRTAKGLVEREVVRVVTPASAVEAHRRQLLPDVVTGMPSGPNEGRGAMSPLGRPDAPMPDQALKTEADTPIPIQLTLFDLATEGSDITQ